VAVSIRILKKRAQVRGPHRYYRPIKGIQFSRSENLWWAEKRARQQAFREDVRAGRVAARGGTWIPADLARSAVVHWP
jgi:hypothetical protein